MPYLADNPTDRPRRQAYQRSTQGKITPKQEDAERDRTGPPRRASKVKVNRLDPTRERPE